MRKFKKFLCAALVSTMVFAMAAPSFADETESEPVVNETHIGDENTKGSITIDNPLKNGEDAVQYTAYKIFDVTYYGNNYAYTISADSPWYNTVNRYAESHSDELKLEVTTDTTLYVVDGENLDAPAFAAYLKNNVPTNATSVELAGDAKEVSAKDLALGYYFVSTNVGTLCNLTTIAPDVTIHDKNEVPKIEKEIVGDHDVEVGQTVNYVITGNVPDTTGYESYTYKVSDTMSDGLTFDQESVKILVNGEDYQELYRRLSVSSSGFILNLDLVDDIYNYNDEIRIEYSATVNENAVANVETNDAKLEYSNNPQNGTSTAEGVGDKEEVYSAKIVIDKYASDDNTQKLAGAKFVLYKEDPVEGEEDEATTVIKYYYYNETTKKVEWVDAQGDATEVETDDEGVAEFTGLKNGTYYLLETEAPTGYNRLTEAVEVTVDGKEVLNILEDATEAEKTEAINSALIDLAGVANSTGSMLPSTGGIGTTIFYAVGIILMAGAVFFVVRRKRA